MKTLLPVLFATCCVLASGLSAPVGFKNGTDGNVRIAVDAILAALSLDAWTVLRRRDNLSLERAVAVWKLTLSALLAQAMGAARA